MNKPFYGAASITNSNRSQIINIEYSHGPGSHDINKQKFASSLPKWSLKPRTDYGSCFKISKQNKPPIGSYQISGDLKHQVTLKNPNYRSQKYRSSNQKIQHMSHLNLPSSISLKTSVTFGYRDDIGTLFKQTNYSPGPIYHVDKCIQQTRSNKITNTCKGFGFGERNGIYKINDIVPGPGAYNTLKTNDTNQNYCQQFQSKSQQKRRTASPTNSTFGKSPRNVYSSTNPLGPGQYSPLTTNNGNIVGPNSGRVFKLKGKLPEAQKYINPNGPGTYDLPDTKCKIGPRFNHQRYNSLNSIDNMNQFETPSPVTYECKRYPQVAAQQKGFSLGKKINSQSSLINVKNPGPGSYQVSENIAKQQLGGYMGRKTLKKKKVINPADDCFGKYNPKFSISARQGSKFTFSTDAKPWNKQIKDQTLGPAHYQWHERKIVQSYSMGTAQRFKQLKKDVTPLYRQNNSATMNSTIGYLPSYLRKQKAIMPHKIAKTQKKSEKQDQNRSNQEKD